MLITKRQTRGAAELLTGRTVAYFCAEYGITDLLPIYSGGLGVLAGDIVQEAARQKLPFVAVGLFYKKGFFHQYTDEDGQHETTQEINPTHVPLELLTDSAGETLLVKVPMHERIVYAQIWRFPVGENGLYLLDTDHWKNSQEDRQITDQLYGGDQAKRIQQELVLGIGGLRALDMLGIQPDIFHLNEGHSAFLALELLRRALEGQAPDQSQIDAAVAVIRRRLIFTNHTLVPAGNDLFPAETLSYWLGKYAYESGVGMDAIMRLGALAEAPGKFSMTMFAMRCSERANAVSKLHAEKAKDLWPEFPLQAVTNGVHLPAWIAPELQHLLDAAIPGWQDAAADPVFWKKVRSIPNEKLWQIHGQLKERMLEEVYARSGVRLDPDALTLVWARRFATYKRPDLLFNDIERLKKLLWNADRPVQVIVAGKSHPADLAGKQIIQHIEELGNYDLKHRAVFVDDYSISLARLLASGADVWLNTPIYGLEASGTSGMKAAANGVIQCTVPDGWAFEVSWKGLGYPLPIDKAEVEIYTVLEKMIVPTYYSRTPRGIPDIWVSMMKENIASIAPRFSSKRMVDQYVTDMYTPALSHHQSDSKK